MVKGHEMYSENTRRNVECEQSSAHRQMWKYWNVNINELYLV